MDDISTNRPKTTIAPQPALDPTRKAKKCAIDYRKF